MYGQSLKEARRERTLTQEAAADRMGVSQPYLALLERGKRRLTKALARRAVRVLQAGPTLLPCDSHSLDQVATTDSFAKQLSALGYSGFEYLRAGWTRNPAEVLLPALAQNELDQRVAEALPWVLLNYPDLDRDWLAREARARNLTNRLGFVVSLARRVAEQRGQVAAKACAALTGLENVLRESRLERETTFGKGVLSEAEQQWIRKNRTADAEQWHVLTTWRPEHLQYA
jgi:transcriptional regulator with XRE-family HTH domain